MKQLKLIRILVLFCLVFSGLWACVEQPRNGAEVPENPLPELDFTHQHAISAGADFIAVLRKDGTVMCLKVNLLSSQTDSCEDPEWKDIVSIATNQYDIAGLKNDGTVVSTNFQDEVSSWKDVIAIDFGDYNILGLKQDGTVLDSMQDDKVQSWEDITEIVAGCGFMAGLRKDGTVAISDGTLMDVSEWKDIRKIAGKGDFLVGQNGAGEMFYAGNRLSQEAVDNIMQWTAIKDFQGGASAVVGVKEDGTVVEAGEEIAVLDAWTDIVEVSFTWGGFVIGLKADGTLETAGMSLHDRETIAQWTDIGIPD